MPPPTPKVGTVDNGFRFTGGSPADPNNWKRLPPKKGAVEDGFRFVGKDPADPNSWSDVDKEAGFWSTLIEGATKFGLADEAAAFAANPTEQNRKKLVAAGDSGRTGVEFGEGANWVAFKQALGGSLGEALAPLAAGFGTSFVGTPIAGLAAATATSGAQNTINNLLRQAQEQERAIAEGKAPEETSVTKALTAAAGQTGLDVAAGPVFKGIAKLFPFAKPLLGEAGEKAAQNTGDVLADAFEKGTVSFTKGVAVGTGKGVAFEIPQEIAQTSLERWQAGLSLSDDEALGEYKQAAIGAALLGGGFGAVSGGLESRRPDTELKPADIEATPLNNIPTEMLDSAAAQVITTPEDQAEFDELVTRLSVSSGIPEEEAKRYALSTIAERKKAERAQQAREAGVTEEVEEADLEAGVAEEAEEAAPIEAVVPAVEEAAPTFTPIPSEEFTPKSVVDLYLAGAGRGDSPFDLELQQYVTNNIDAVETEFASRAPTAAAPTAAAPTAPNVAPPAGIAPAPTIEIAPAPTIEIAPAPTIEIAPAPTVETAPAPLASVYEAPNMAARVAAAKPIVFNIIESIPGMADVKVPTKLVSTAANQIARLAANQQTFDPVQIVTRALTASGVTPNPVEAAPAPEPVAPSVEDVATAPEAAPAFVDVPAPEFKEPQFAQAETVPEPMQVAVQEPVRGPVPFKETVDEAVARGLEIQKVAAAAASGTKPVQRGKQGNKKGRPVEGAAELTDGMRAQGALNTDLQAALDNQEITNAEMREVVDYMRAPENRLQLRDKPEDIRPQWRKVLDLSDKVELQQQLVYDLPTRDKARPAAQAVLDELKTNLNAAQTDIVNNARAKLDAARTSRVAGRQKVEEDFKSGKITERERRVQLGELNISRVEPGGLMGGATMDIDKYRGSTLSDLLEEIFRNADNKFSEYDTYLAGRIANLLPQVEAAGLNVKLHIIQKGDRAPTSVATGSAYGAVSVSLNKKTVDVYLRSSQLGENRAGNTSEVVLHEALHAVSSSLIVAEKLGRNTPKISKFVGDLRDLRNAVVDHFNQRVKSGAELTELETSWYNRDSNVFADLDEFLAWGMTNDKAQEYLRSIKVGPKDTLFTRFIAMFKALLDIPDGDTSALNRLIEIVNPLFEATKADYKAVAGAKAKSTSPASEGVNRAEEKMDRGLYKAQMSNTATGLLEGIDEAVAGAKLTGKEKRRATFEALDAGKGSVILPFQPTSWIRENITKKLPGLGSIINGIDKLEQNMRGMRTSMRTALSRRVAEFEDFVNKNGQGAMASMMTIARVNRVDVTAYDTRAEALANDPVIRFEKTRNNIKGIRKREKAVNTAWDAWEALGKQPGGHALYKKVRQFYKDMHTALRAAQDQDIRNLGLSKEATDKLIREARGDMDEDTVTDKDDDNPGVPQKLFPKEYFPFRRFGKYALIVKEGKRTERERYHFDTMRERNLFELQVAKKLGLQRGSSAYNSTFKRIDGLENLRDDVANNEGFMLKRMFDVIDKAKAEATNETGGGTIATESLKNKLYQTYLLTLPERSLQKQLIHAKLVPGQSADVLNVFRTSVAQYSAQLPKVVYGGQIQKQIEAAYDSISTEMDPAERAKITAQVDAFVSRVRATADSEAYGPIEQFISSFTFLSLMTSIASAAVQPLTLPFQVMPRMFARYGFGPTLAAVGKYTPVFSLVEASVDIDPVTGARRLVAPTIGNTTFIKSNPLRARLWDELNLKRDLFSQKQTDMLLRDRPTKSTARDTGLQKLSGAYETLVDKSGAIFSSADQITREVSGMSFAELEYNRLIKAGKSHEAAIEGAVEAAVNNTNETIGNYTELEKLDVFRGGPLRRMIGFLRTYSVQRTAYYFRMLGALTKNDPTQTKLQAFNELSMVLVFTSAAAGLSANFGYSFITGMLDLMLPALLGEDEMEEWRKKDPLGADDADYRFRFQWLPENFGADSTAVRVMQKGLLSELTGWDWSTRLSQSSLWLREGREGESTRDDVVNFLVANLAPQVSQSANMIDGVDDFARGEWSKGFSKIVPAAVRGAVTAERQAREGDTTKTGKITRGAGEFTTGELVGQVLGFTPDELSRVREINRTTNQWQRSMKKERGELFQEFRSVYGDGAREGLEAAFEKMRKFNPKVALGRDGTPLGTYLIEGKDLERSLQSAENLEEKSYRGVEYNDGEEEYFFPYESRKPVVE